MDGILSPPLVAGGWVAAGAATAACLRGAREERIPHAAVLTACFFVASTIHVPFLGASVHLVLNGLCGVVLGALAFPAILVGLLLQFLLFSHGGISVLGFNACAMGLPALAAGAGFRLWRRTGPGRRGTGVVAGAFVGGGGAVLVGAAIVAGALTLGGKPEARLAPFFFGAHVVIAAIEGTVTALTVRFLMRVEPKLLAEGVP